jgi:hypothetical protein
MSSAGKARNRRGTQDAAIRPQINAFRAQHLALTRSVLCDQDGARSVTVNEAESPLIWLARRSGRDGRPLIEPRQFQAGERLRADFTRANVMPRMGADWSSPIGRSGGGERGGQFTETMIAARQRVRLALDAVGPEFSGLLLDVCCFLRSLTEIERTRGWPARSGKVILQLALDRLARHYGIETQAQGRPHVGIRSWVDGDATALSSEAYIGLREQHVKSKI